MIGQADVGMGNSQEITGSPQNCVSFWQRGFFPKLQVTSPISACIAHYLRDGCGKVNKAAQAFRLSGV